MRPHLRRFTDHGAVDEIDDPAFIANQLGGVREEDAAIRALPLRISWREVLPDMIDGLRDKCAPHLPANAYLVGNADMLVTRYKVTADQRWPAAKLAFGKIAGDEKIAASMPDQFLRPLIGSMIGAELFKDVKPVDCSGASRIVESLAPLPPENVSMLIGAVLTMVEDKGKEDSMPICKGNAG